MDTTAEIKRIARAYGGYRARGWSQTKWSDANPGNQAIREERERLVRRALERGGFFPLDERQILDVGCGLGESLAGYKEQGAPAGNLHGVDLLESRVREASAQFPDISFRQANAEALPFANETFDLANVFTVFSSILNTSMAQNASGEIARVLRPGGAVVWYDFRMDNPLNPHVRGITRRRISSLFPGFEQRLRRATVIPPLIRRAGRAAKIIYPFLSSVPFLCSHYLGLVVKPRMAAS